MCRPTGSWFWDSWSRTGYPYSWHFECKFFLKRGPNFGDLGGTYIYPPKTYLSTPPSPPPGVNKTRLKGCKTRSLFLWSIGTIYCYISHFFRRSKDPGVQMVHIGCILKTDLERNSLLLVWHIRFAVKRFYCWNTNLRWIWINELPYYTYPKESCTRSFHVLGNHDFLVPFLSFDWFSLHRLAFSLVSAE